MKMRWVLVLALVMVAGCGGFQAKRVARGESDERALGITDDWVMRDTETSVKNILQQVKRHRGLRKYLRKLGRSPRVFIADVQNRTSEPYFPVDDLNDELLNEFSASGDYVLIDEARRDALLQEVRYQNDGMVTANEAKSIGRQVGADLMIFGAIRMSPKSRGGKTVKEYSVNLRMTDVERGVEVLRTRVKVNKYSERGRFGW